MSKKVVVILSDGDARIVRALARYRQDHNYPYATHSAILREAWAQWWGFHASTWAGDLNSYLETMDNPEK